MRWSTLSARERRTISLGGAIVVVSPLVVVATVDVAPGLVVVVGTGGVPVGVVVAVAPGVGAFAGAAGGDGRSDAGGRRRGVG